MMIETGIIEPGSRIGDFYIDALKENVISRLDSQYDVWERQDGFSIYSFDNFKLWFDVEGKLMQIGVTKGFHGDYKSICIGSTMSEIVKTFGKSKYWQNSIKRNNKISGYLGIALNTRF